MDVEPTNHEGVIARKIEKLGKIADRCQMNREIAERNEIRVKLRSLVNGLMKV